MGEFTAIGGVALDTAHVTGDVVARGARIGAGEGDAIGAQAARFDGVVILGDGFVAAGVIWLMGARIAGTLDMNAARLVNRAEDGSGVVLAADTAEIGGSVLLRNGFSAEGAISLRGARIGSSLECDGASLTNATADGAGIALAADHAVIGGAVLLRNGFAAQGAISLIGARIGGNLECDGASLTNATADGTGVALAAENAVIGGAVLLRHGFVARGGVSLLGATIDSNVECCGAALENWSETGSRETLRLTNVEIAGDVLLNLGFTSLGYVSLWGTKIGRDLDCSTATFIGPSPVASGRSMAGAMVATNLAVAGDMKLIDVTVLGRIDCENLQTGGSLIWDGLRFPREVDRRRRTPRLPHRGRRAAADAAVARADRSGAGGARPHRGGGVGDRPRRRQGRHAGRCRVSDRLGGRPERGRDCSAPSTSTASSTTGSATCRPTKPAASPSRCRPWVAGRRISTAAIRRPGRFAWRVACCARSGRMCDSAWRGCSASRAAAASSIRSHTGIWRRSCARRATTRRPARSPSWNSGRRRRPTG